MSRGVSPEEQIFADALARPVHERAAFVDGACRGDAVLHGRILVLLKAHLGSQSLLASAPVKAAATIDEERAGDMIGRYKLLQKIGEGGCGVVWMAEQEEPVRRRVALKIIKLGMDTKAVVARFEAERQALAMMDHPNIAKVHDAGATDTGRPFFVMELVRGIPITKYCDDNHLTLTARLELFIQVCQAVQHAHQKGIIHRDLKPSNILVTVNDGAPMPKIIDFGIAKATQGRLTDATVFTAFEQFIGTPVYMSPEQAEMGSLDIDTRSDIYSLGVLLYELLTGRPPFDPKKFAEAGVEGIRRQIREVEPPRPSARLGTLEVARAFRPRRDIRTAPRGRDAHATHSQDAESFRRAGRPCHLEPLTTIAHLRSTTPRELISLLRGDLDWIVMRCMEKDRTRRYDSANGLAMDIQRYLRNEPVVARPPSTAYLLQKLIRRHRVAFAGGALTVVSLAAGFATTAFAFVRERSARQIAAEARISGERLLTFVFTDLGEQLHDVGQLALLRQLTEKTLDYYERLPSALHTRETRANYAFALAGVGTIGWIFASTSGESNFGRPAARARLDRAMGIFDELERTGPLSPFMRVAAGGICCTIAEQNAGESRLDEAIRTYVRGEILVVPATSDPDWGGWALRQQAKLVHGKAYRLLRVGRANEAVPEFERAVDLAAEADRRGRHARRPGFHGLHIHSDMIEALLESGRRADARTMALRVCHEMRDSLRREPHLVTAKWALAIALKNLVLQCESEWQFDEARTALRESRREFEDLLSGDPRNWAYYGWLPYLLVREARLDWFTGAFADAETSLRNAIELASADFTPPDGRRDLYAVYALLAPLCAATRRESDVDQVLTTVNQLEKRMADERPWRTTRERLLASVHGMALRRDADFQRLNWAGMQENARQALARLETPDVREDGREVEARVAARRDLIRATFESGDYTSARRELDRWTLSPSVPETAAPLQSRFSRLGDLLLRIHVLARSGESKFACDELTRLWPEVEAVFSAGPDYLFNQVQTARALSIRTEIDGTTDEKRAWLERAAGYLRPAAAAGRLTRYEREVLLAGVETQLTTLTPDTLP